MSGQLPIVSRPLEQLGDDAGAPAVKTVPVHVAVAAREMRYGASRARLLGESATGLMPVCWRLGRSSVVIVATLRLLLRRSQAQPTSRRVSENLLPSAVVRGRKNPLHFGFALQLAHARAAADMAGAALSLAVGMHRGAASELEGGDRVPRVDTVEKLAKVLHLSPCYLAFGIEQPCDAAPGSLSAGLPGR